MTSTGQRPPGSARRTWLIGLLMAVLVVPAAEPPPAAAHALAPVAERQDVAATNAGQSPIEPAVPAPEAQLAPSVHWLHAEEHAADPIAFEPGELVSVPFTPGPDDTWPVDASAPRELPAGHATGREMLEAAQGSVWTAAPPDEVLHVDDTTLPATAAGGSTVQPASAAPPGRPGGLRREVFGFLPYWELADRSTVLDWRTLSTVAYFSVGCTGSGSLLKRNLDGSPTVGWAGWTSSRMTAIINAAHQHHVRVVLTVSCFAWSGNGAATQAALLGSPAARRSLARQVAAAVRDRGADGVNLDFEPILGGYGDEFTKLVRAVRSELNAIARGYQLTFDAMGSVGNQPVAEATAPGGADAVFVMGYDYRTAGASIAGSISPLAGPVYDLADTVEAYTALVPPSKVILGIPYYGRAWSTTSSALHAGTLSDARYGGVASPTYAQLVGLVAAHGRRWDSVEHAPWTAYRKETCTAEHGCAVSWRQLYYDDAGSLRRRYDLVNREGLRGAGIWALGYEDGRTELRAALASKFLRDVTAPVAGIATLPQRVRDEGFRVAWKAHDDSPIAHYDVQVSRNGGRWASWLWRTTSQSSIFWGTDGATYAFRVRATDVRGNVSAWKSVPLARLGPPSRLMPGTFATVVTDGLRLRAAPSTGADAITTLDAGAALRIVAGPAMAGGLAWYQVVGPVRQWAPVDVPHVGGWVAARGNGITNVAPRAPVYATTVAAGITGLRLARGGSRTLTPGGAGPQARLRLDWTNKRAFDRLFLLVHRIDGTYVGAVRVSATAPGPATYWWNGRIDGAAVRPGAYVVRLQGVDDGLTFNAPSISAVGHVQVARYGVVVSASASTSARFAGPGSPTRAQSFTYRLTFGAPISGLTAGDLVGRGTASGCSIAAPVGSGARWSVEISGCRPGTFVLALKRAAVVDAVGNVGPPAPTAGPAVLVDRAAPVATVPSAKLSAGVALASASSDAGIPAELILSAVDRGGAGVAGYEVARSLDGRPFVTIAHAAVASMRVALRPGHAYRFSVRARDAAGNVGGWVAGPTLRAFLVQDVTTALWWRGPWLTVHKAWHSGGTSHLSKPVGAVASFTFTGRAIAWVASRGPDRGVVEIHVDGMRVETIDTRAATASARAVVFSRGWASVGTHTLRLEALGTAGRPRIDVDAFIVLR